MSQFERRQEAAILLAPHVLLKIQALFEQRKSTCISPLMAQVIAWAVQVGGAHG